MALERPKYTEEAAKRILQQALDLQMREQDASFSRDQLTEMAQELGISPETLQAAEQQWLREQEGREEREAEQAEIQAFLRDRRQNYKAHLVTYACVNLFLFIISIMGGEFWFIYPLLGWGIGIAMHTWYVNQTEGETFERELEQWREQRRLTHGNPPSLTS
jgi:hypothetical protein